MARGHQSRSDVPALDSEADGLARSYPLWPPFSDPADLVAVDTLITAGIAASRPESALARIREQPAYATLSEQAQKAGALDARASTERVAQDQLQNAGLMGR
jgi:hypothetical protein